MEIFTEVGTAAVIKSQLLAHYLHIVGLSIYITEQPISELGYCPKKVRNQWLEGGFYAKSESKNRLKKALILAKKKADRKTECAAGRIWK